jgi:hypothetical protein
MPAALVLIFCVAMAVYDTVREFVEYRDPAQGTRSIRVMVSEKKWDEIPPSPDHQGGTRKEKKRALTNHL